MLQQHGESIEKLQVDVLDINKKLDLILVMLTRATSNRTTSNLPSSMTANPALFVPNNQVRRIEETTDPTTHTEEQKHGYHEGFGWDRGQGIP